MGCASSKPSSSSTTTSKHAHKKSKDKSSPAKSDQISPSTNQQETNNNNNNKKSSSVNKTNGTSAGGQHHLSEATQNGSLHDKSPLHLKQQAQAERARRLAHHLNIDESLLHEIDQQRNRVITYLVTSVRRDLNSELIASHHGSGSNKLADLVMAAAAATDNDDLIIDVVSRAVLLILNGTAGHTYKDLSDQLKSHQYLCKHQQHKQRICEITVDTIYGALEGGSGGGSSLAEFLTGETSMTTSQQQQMRTPHSGSGGGGGDANYHQDAVLLSRSQAKEVARILFLTDRARPVVHASPNSAHKDAYFVNKQLSDMSEVTVSKTEIDEILRAFERPEPIEIAALSSPPRAKNLIDDFNSITLEPQQPQQQTVTRIVIDGEETIPSDVTIQFEDQQQQQQHHHQHQQQTYHERLETTNEEDANNNPNAAQEALNTLVAISALATKLNNERNSSSNNGDDVGVILSTSTSSPPQVVIVDSSPSSEKPLDSNNNNLVADDVDAPVVVVKTSSENISSISSSSAQVEHNLTNTQENGDLDPTLKQSLLDDRFYNNDAFKTEPPVNGESINEAATVIQASFKGHQERKETEEEEVEETTMTTPSNVVINEPVQELERSESNEQQQDETPLTPKPSLQEINTAVDASPQQQDEEVVAVATNAETTEEHHNNHHHHEIHNEEEAATMIQATYRGYKTRKELKVATKSVEGEDDEAAEAAPSSPEPQQQSPIEPEQQQQQQETTTIDTNNQEADSNTTPSGQHPNITPSSSSNNLDQAATKIQATFRGFRTRKELSAKDLKKKKKKNTNNNNNLLKTGASSSLPSLNASASLNNSSSSSNNNDHDPNNNNSKELTLSNKQNDDLVNDNNKNNNSNIINSSSLLTTTNNKNNNNNNNSIINQQYCSQDYLSSIRSVDSSTYEGKSRSDDKMEQILNRAATKIQSTFRGYKTRKNMTSKQKKSASTMEKSKSQPNCSTSVQHRQHSPITDPEKAAVKIQATFRGYKTRKQLQASRSANASISANLGGSNNCVHTVQSDYHRNVKLEGSKQQQQQPEQSSSDINTKIKLNNTSPESTSNSATLEKKKKKRNKKKRKQQVKA